MIKICLALWGFIYKLSLNKRHGEKMAWQWAKGCCERGTKTQSVSWFLTSIDQYDLLMSLYITVASQCRGSLGSVLYAVFTMVIKPKYLKDQKWDAKISGSLFSWRKKEIGRLSRVPEEAKILMVLQREVYSIHLSMTVESYPLQI